MSTDKTIADVANVNVMQAWKQQLEIQKLVELIADEFIHHIQPLVRARSESAISEMCEEHGSDPDIFASTPDRDAALAAEVYPNLLYSSLFAASYFAFERSLHEICRTLQEAQGQDIAPNDLAGSGIKRSQLYLNKVAGFTFPEEPQRWQRISDLHELRNVVAHNGGRLEPGRASKQLFRIVEQHPHLTLQKTGDIQFSSQFVSDACFLMQDLLLELSSTIFESTDEFTEMLDRELGSQD
jgi:hypothetical protein